MTEVKELTAETKEVLIEIEKLKIDIKNSMMHGEARILKGIDIFAELLMKFNPTLLDENENAMIEKYVRRYLIEREEKMQHVDAYVNYGVNRCLLILHLYNKKENKTLKKSKFGFTFK